MSVRGDPLVTLLVALRDLRLKIATTEAAVREVMEERGRTLTHDSAEHLRESAGLCFDDEPPSKEP